LLHSSSLNTFTSIFGQSINSQAIQQWSEPIPTAAMSRPAKRTRTGETVEVPDAQPAPLFHNSLPGAATLPIGFGRPSCAPAPYQQPTVPQRPRLPTSFLPSMPVTAPVPQQPYKDPASVTAIVNALDEATVRQILIDAALCPGAPQLAILKQLSQQSAMGAGSSSSQMGSGPPSDAGETSSIGYRSTSGTPEYEMHCQQWA
jgi:hypothetical protein